MAAERKEKVIRVLQILQTADKKTPDRRSIYRDVKMLQSCGYPIE